MGNPAITGFGYVGLRGRLSACSPPCRHAVIHAVLAQYNLSDFCVDLLSLPPHLSPGTTTLALLGKHKSVTQSTDCTQACRADIDAGEHGGWDCIAGVRRFWCYTARMEARFIVSLWDFGDGR